MFELCDADIGLELHNNACGGTWMTELGDISDTDDLESAGKCAASGSTWMPELGELGEAESQDNVFGVGTWMPVLGKGVSRAEDEE